MTTIRSDDGNKQTKNREMAKQIADGKSAIEKLLLEMLTFNINGGNAGDDD